jgi:peptidoglycan/xylan/chitin deacetylase (PgdA/CDA1 family)
VTVAASASALHNSASAVVFMALSPTIFEVARSLSLMIRRFVYALILILSAYATAVAQDLPLGTTSPTPNASSIEKITFSEVNVDGPYIAMTFDDGPHATNTAKLLEMAAERHIKLTFFVLGECIEQNPDVLRREVAEGHEIGNHSCSHPNLAKLSDADVRSQLQRTEDIIVKTAGIKPKLMRPPYGELTKRQRILVNHEFGYKVILWDVDPLDWKRPGPDVVAQRIIAGARPGSIILSHDIHPPTIAAMPQVFDALLAKGFKFVTVSELLAMDKGGERKPSK